MATVNSTEKEMADIEKGAPQRPSPIVLKFVNVHHSVSLEHGTSCNPRLPINCAPEKKSEKDILRGISGSIHPGEMLAIMGPSGSGKTTLLHILGGRGNGFTSGTITYNDVPYHKHLKSRIGFVTQDDVLFQHLTVKETLTYAAMLRLPKNCTKKEKLQRVEKTIIELGLSKCQDTIIGGPFLRGISGGERKRVCISHEILIEPSILLLDEPTSGLDATTSLRLIQTLHQLAKAGRTVITTIHQPSSKIFSLFDDILLLTQGFPIYTGPPERAMEYFGCFGIFPSNECNLNPADFLLDLANGSTIDINVPPKSGGDDIVQWLGNLHSMHIRKPDVPLISDMASAPEAKKADKNFSAPWWLQVAVLHTRGLREHRHEYHSFYRVLYLLSSSFICGLLWFNSRVSTLQDVHNQGALIFFILIVWGFFPFLTALQAFPSDRLVLCKERNLNMYQLSAYFVSRNLADLPMECMIAFFYTMIVFLFANLGLSLGTYTLLLLLVFVMIWTAQSFGYAVGAATMDGKSSHSLGIMLLLTFILTSGFYITKVPSWMHWSRYTSFFYYGYVTGLKLTFRADQTYDCDSPGGCKTIGSANPFPGYAFSDGFNELWILVGISTANRILAYAFLRRMKTN